MSAVIEMLRIIDEKAAAFGGKSLESLRIGREPLTQMSAADFIAVPFELFPFGKLLRGHADSV